jgi:predicted SAM-dependent methyltransferase
LGEGERQHCDYPLTPSHPAPPQARGQEEGGGARRRLSGTASRAELRRGLREWGSGRSPSSGLKLHLGCGPNRKAGWINIDLLAEGVDLALDLREPLPFPDSSVTDVYSEHIIEHFEQADAIRLLRESWRVPVAGGLMSVGFPDAEEELLAYAHGREEYFQTERERLYELRHATRMQIVNHDFRQWGEHKYAYDLETLTVMLQEAGFVSIRKRSFDPMRDSESRRLETMYVDARKPAGTTLP